MKHALFFFILAYLFFSKEICTAQNSKSLHYKVDHSVLTTSHLTELDAWVELINLDSLVGIKITGHTDSSASFIYNIALSQKRGENVKNYFLKKGLSEEEIQISYHGEKFANSTMELGYDRRVDIQLFFAEKAVINTAPTPKPETASTTTIQDFYKEVSPKPQEFCINPQKDTILRCKYGTLITIKAESFDLSAQQKASNLCVVFQVKEAFLKSEMILENLNTTTTSRDILETFGMVYTNAMIGQDTLELKKDIVIMIPTDKIDDDLRIFDGVENPHNGSINWALNNNSVLRNFSLANVEHCITYNNIFRDCGCDSMSIKIVENFGINCCWGNYCYWFDNYCFGGSNSMCKCKFFFCQFNELFLWIATLFDPQMREIEKNVILCRRRLRAVIQIKRFQNFQRRWQKRTSSRERKAISRQKYVKKIRKQLVRRKVRKKEEKGTKEEQRIMELTTLLMESDRKVRTGLRGMVKNEFVAKCNTLDSLFKIYEVDNTEALVTALNKPLMEELGVNTMEALLDTLPKINMGNLEVAYRNKKISYEDFKFYVFNSSNLGWKNCDVFSDVSMDDRITIKVNAIPDKTMDSKLVYQKRNFVLPGKIGAKKFYFDDVPKKEEAWLIGIQYKNATPLFSMELIGMDKKNYALNLKEVSLEELKEKLKVLDFEAQ